ncbi:acyl-CoA synthetase (NDP forming) [Jonquetella anthropi DSM 22815]|uniref:Acyl-CoA synthetase (NDP forming) n=3 Tax=Dethiosulfovibrionaceae TaxID=3029088 RepID=H0UJM3_9BACT|nr:hypothetical protein GCWU000246_00601 [Jonquetella anthropi E3_33 E1]EHM12891.1 acyl-CoA synthetase (NDP forming) [Jonquetella anthropi DSM 22815]
MCEAAFFVGVSREMAGEKMKQVLLVTGDQPTQEDVRPLESIHRIGLASLTVASQSEVLAAGEAFGGRDVVLLAPSCDRPELLDWCERWKPQRLVVGSDGDFGASSGQLARIRRGGTFVLGPGSRGVLDPLQDLFVSWTPAVQPSAALDGNVALIGQGGAVVFSLFDMALEAGVKFRQVVSLGVCQDDGALLECLDQCAEDGQTRLVVLCAESFVQGRRVMERAARLVRQGVPVVLLRCGVFPGIDRRARLRHPDGNWADDATWRAVAERYGVTLLSDVGELLAFAKLYGCSRPAQGLSIAGLASSVGLALLLRDSCFRAGVALPAFSPELTEKLEKVLPPRAKAVNPISGTESLVQSDGVLSEALRRIHSGGRCLPFVVLGALGGDEVARVVSELAEAGRDIASPIVLCCLGDWRRFAGYGDLLARSGVVVYRDPAEAARAIALAEKISASSVRALPSQPVPPAPKLPELPERPDEAQVMDLMKSYQLSLVPSRFCSSLAEVMSAADELGFPLVLKAVSPSLLNKQQARGVALNLRTPEELRNAYGRVLERVSRGHPEAKLRGVLVQTMVTDGLECMIGLKRDPLFGPVVAVALGGAYYAMTRDIALRPAPVTFEEAQEMISSLKGASLITGSWSGVPLASDELARTIAQMSVMGDCEPDLELLDINPIFVRPNAAEIADAFIRRTERSRQ